MAGILWGIIVVLFVVWLLGFIFAFKVVGGLIHIVLVVAIILLIYNLIMGARSRRSL